MYNMTMNNLFVVSVDRDRWYQPKLTVTVLARVPSERAGERFITSKVMEAYARRCKSKFGRMPSMRVKEMRLVDELGLKRLQAAAKASVTLRRRRAAKRAAATRAKNRAAKAQCNTMLPPINLILGANSR